MADATGGDQIISIPEEAEEGWWLFKIMEGQDPPSRPKPRIQKVAETLRQINSNKTCFDPCVVSFGPYHHGEACLMPMERYKEVSARWFLSPLASNNAVNVAITRNEARNVYNRFVEKATNISPLRDCYADKFMDKFNGEDFMKMMFLDGCFILHFIHLVVNGSDDLSKSSHLNQPLILRDMFLLENQIPYSILKALMSLKPERCREFHVIQFIYTVFLPRCEFHYGETIVIGIIKVLFFCFMSLFSTRRKAAIDGNFLKTLQKSGDPVHLLDLLRSRLIGKGTNPSSRRSYYWNYYFCPIRELKATGIQVSRSNSRSLENVKFKRGLINSHLELPQIIVDDSTKTRLLNLVAYEMCPDGLLDRVVTSYACFLDSLIYNADDVKELRSKNILLNRLGSDEEVANLFKELANNLSPNYEAYSDVIEGIELHSKRRFNHVRVWIGQFLHTHFTSPWTVISLIAAIFVILLALLQTIYAVLSYYKSN